ncbi:hypothetical protein EJB05_27280 [Eragrostis curvula]|uniref:Uncharacterized protein n=1 Tax=Eragrostis curvula TaxID=38414 RepID=A0A5J9UNU3_9POAL|nr:hypothetical protein EJB05_27280 [Eragrostis curvula]
MAEVAVPLREIHAGRHPPRAPRRLPQFASSSPCRPRPPRAQLRPSPSARSTPAVALRDLHAVCSILRAPPPAGHALCEVHYDRRPPRARTPATALCEIHAVTSLRELQRRLHPHHIPHQWCPPHLLQWMSPGMVAHIGDRRIWKRPCASCSRRF